MKPRKNRPKAKNKEAAAKTAFKASDFFLGDRNIRAHTNKWHLKDLVVLSKHILGFL